MGVCRFCGCDTGRGFSGGRDQGQGEPIGEPDCGGCDGGVAREGLSQWEFVALVGVTRGRGFSGGRGQGRGEPIVRPDRGGRDGGVAREGLSQWELVAPVGVTRGVASWVGVARGGAIK